MTVAIRQGMEAVRPKYAAGGEDVRPARQGLMVAGHASRRTGRGRYRPARQERSAIDTFMLRHVSVAEKD